MTPAGGWGVVTADAITRDRDLDLIDLPDDLREAVDAKLPPRWSRANPVDLAGGETRDTIPEAVSYTHLRAPEHVLALVCRLLLDKNKTTTAGYNIETQCKDR